MILSIQNGHILPQLHVCCDDMFETIKDMVNVPPSRWQVKTGLVNLDTTDESVATPNKLINNSFTGAGLGEHVTSQLDDTGEEQGENEHAIFQDMNEEEPAPTVEEVVTDNEPIVDQSRKWSS